MSLISYLLSLTFYLIMKRILLAISFLIGGVASAQQDLQEQINQLRAEINQLKANPAPLPENENSLFIRNLICTSTSKEVLM